MYCKRFRVLLILGPSMSPGTDWNVFCMEAGGVGALFRQSAFLAEDAFSADHTSHSEIPCKQRHMALPRPLGGRRAGGGRWPPVHAMGGWIPPIGPLGGGGARVCYPRSWKGRHRASSDRHFEGMPGHTNNTTRPSGAGVPGLIPHSISHYVPLWAHLRAL